MLYTVLKSGTYQRHDSAFVNLSLDGIKQVNQWYSAISTWMKKVKIDVEGASNSERENIPCAVLHRCEAPRMGQY